MKAEIRRLHSPDAYSLQSWAPDDPTSFAILIQAMVGPRGIEGEESFDFVVCTPEWLRRTLGEDAAVLGRHYVLVFRYDFDRIKTLIEAVVAQAEGNSWEEVALRIARHGKWEFEDYQPHASERGRDG